MGILEGSPVPDAYLLLGDNSENDIRTILELIRGKAPIYGVLGNHDTWSHYDRFPEVQDLHGKTAHLDGLTIGGLSGSLRYKPGGGCMLSQEESIEGAAGLAGEQIDILITHDKAADRYCTYEPKGGLVGISRCLAECRIPVHIHGHLHSPRTIILPNGTSSRCVFQTEAVSI